MIPKGSLKRRIARATEDNPEIGEGQWLCAECKFVNTVLNWTDTGEAKCEICHAFNMNILNQIHEEIRKEELKE